MNRVYNFSAGPSMLPLPVLEKAAAELVCYGESGMIISTHIDLQIVLFFSSSCSAISSKSCSFFCSLFSIPIFSPFSSSFTLMPRISQSCSISDASGSALPVSHFDTALSVMFNRSPSCICVRSALFLHSAINLPIFI